MLCDVVYAIGLILAAKFGLSKFVDNAESEGFKLFRKVVYISSIAALVCGLLTGNYLGDFNQLIGIESLALSRQVSEVLQNPMSFILISLVIGIVHVNIGHVLGFIKGIKDKEKGVMPNKIGIFLLQICGIPVIMHSMFGANIPFLNDQAYSIMMYILIASIVLIIISSVMQKGAFLGGIFWIFDLTGLLGDIMSYARLAGVGLATFYLGSVFNMMGSLLSNMISSLLPNIGGIIAGVIVMVIILIAGHALNLILSSLTGFIHSIRLCFVEFLFKFFEGGGQEYGPFRLKGRAPIMVKEGTMK
jgi:V/A-type H+-transporting ATPase subunit I